MKTNIRFSGGTAVITGVAGGVDLLFNNAGVMSTGFSWEISPESFQRALSINVLGLHNGIRAFVPPASSSFAS